MIHVVDADREWPTGRLGRPPRRAGVGPAAVMSTRGMSRWLREDLCHHLWPINLSNYTIAMWSFSAIRHIAHASSPPAPRAVSVVARVGR